MKNVAAEKESDTNHVKGYMKRVKRSEHADSSVREDVILADDQILA